MQLISLSYDDTTLETPNVALALQVLSSLISPTSSTPAAPSAIPAIGTYWEGQGGIYGGVRQYEDGLFHVVFAKEDIGVYAWGESGSETGATSRINGLLNTTALLDESGSFPAAEAAANYTADGHTDFYLPAIGELNHAWQFIPESFEKDWYWSSSQRSAYGAFGQYFGDGCQYGNGKHNELRVRPVRRLLI